MPGLYPTAYGAAFPAFFMRLALVCFYCLCVSVSVLYFIATMSFAGYFLSVLFCLLSMLISDSRFDLVWFRLSCDHGWIRSGSVNVRKQQQQPNQNPRSENPSRRNELSFSICDITLFIRLDYILLYYEAKVGWGGGARGRVVKVRKLSRLID